MTSPPPLEQQIERAVDILRRGGIVAFPTDTVYGLGADASCEKAVENIYRVKRRARKLPLPLLLESEADILKVGHHGADDASSPEFLKAVSPRISVISVNKENIRGYPSDLVIERLRQAGSQLYRTDRDADIVVRVSQSGQIRVEK